jgi:hypothetical protein
VPARIAMAFHAVLAQRLAALADDLTAAAAGDLKPLNDQINDLTAARDRFRARAEELAAANDALSLELEARAAEHEAAATATLALEAAREQSARLASQLASTEAQFAEIQREHTRLGDEMRVLRKEAERQQAERTETGAALADATGARDRERRGRETAEAELQRIQAQLADIQPAHQADLARLQQELEEVRHAAEGEATLLREELAIARSSNRERLVARLGQVFDQIASSMSVEDVLSAAANGLSEDFPRVAVFAPHDGRLEARYQCGFDPDSGIGQLTPALDDGSLLAKAAGSDQLQLHSPNAGGSPFTGSPSVMVTAPIVVRGELLALIYADNDGQTHVVESSTTPARVADIVRRHTALRLDRLTVELKTMGELRAYARMLLDEVEYVYRADVSARKPDSERLERLTENLRCARQIFQQRVAVEGPSMSGLLEEVLASVMAAKASSPFGREIGSVASQAHPAVAQAV